MSGAIHLDRHGPHVALIRIDRPEARNALTPRMLCALADAFLAVRDDAEVRAVVLTGTGDVAFCAGGELGLTLPLMTGARAPQDEFDRRLLDDPRTLAASSLRGFDIVKPTTRLRWKTPPSAKSCAARTPAKARWPSSKSARPGSWVADR